jgi:hypothetical protein
MKSSSAVLGFLLAEFSSDALCVGRVMEAATLECLHDATKTTQVPLL